MIIEISVAVIALAFVFLVIYLAKALSGLNKNFDDIHKTLVAIQPQISEISEQTALSLKNANAIAEDVKGKINTFDPVFRSFSKVGHSFENWTDENLTQGCCYDGSCECDCPCCRKSYSKNKKFKPEKKSDQVLDFIEWAALGIHLFSQFKKRG